MRFDVVRNGQILPIRWGSCPYTIRLSEPYGLVVNKAIVKRVSVALSKSWRLNQDNGTGQLCPVKELRPRSQIDQCSSWCNILWFTLRFLLMIVLLMTRAYLQTEKLINISRYIYIWGHSQMRSSLGGTVGVWKRWRLMTWGGGGGYGVDDLIKKVT